MKDITIAKARWIRSLMAVRKMKKRLPPLSREEAEIMFAAMVEKTESRKKRKAKADDAISQGSYNTQSAVEN